VDGFRRGAQQPLAGVIRMSAFFDLRASGGQPTSNFDQQAGKY
jgi:hypothetical protein